MPTRKPKQKCKPARRECRVDDVDMDLPLPDLLGIEIQYQPDEESPPVDFDRLGRYVRRELSPPETEEVCRLVARYRPWNDACTKLMRQKLSD